MKQERVITLGREFGSGGREVGLRLAKRLNIPFYDKELIAKVAQTGNFSPDVLRQMEERAPELPGMVLRPACFAVYQQPMSDQIFLEQSRVIRNVAELGPCVIVGRCADYVLEQRKPMNLFIYARLADRVARKQSLGLDVPQEKMEKHVLCMDKQRAKYYQYYTGRPWGCMRDFDLCVNTSAVGIDGAVETIFAFLEQTQQDT